MSGVENKEKNLYALLEKLGEISTSYSHSSYDAEKIKTEAKVIKGPKVGAPDQVTQGFLKAKNVSQKDLIEKDTDKGKFYFIKTQSQSILVEDLLIKIIPKAIGSINWKKSMKWSDHNLMWGRPLRTIFARYNNKNTLSKIIT